MLEERLKVNSTHSLVFGRPWTEDSAVPSIYLLASFPDMRGKENGIDDRDLPHQYQPIGRCLNPSYSLKQHIWARQTY
jgi:hypothetical protein